MKRLETNCTDFRSESFLFLLPFQASNGKYTENNYSNLKNEIKNSLEAYNVNNAEAYLFNYSVNELIRIHDSLNIEKRNLRFNI